MPKAAKAFRNFPKKPTRSVARGTTAQRGYDAEWRKFRAWFASVVPPICGDKLGGSETQFACGQAFPGNKMHLDHLEAIDGISDPRRLDETNCAWRCLWCHAKKTNAKDGGFGRAAD